MKGRKLSRLYGRYDAEQTTHAGWSRRHARATAPHRSRTARRAPSVEIVWPGGWQAVHTSARAGLGHESVHDL
jgi:hypothetical protein